MVRDWNQQLGFELCYTMDPRSNPREERKAMEEGVWEWYRLLAIEVDWTGSSRYGLFRRCLIRIKYGGYWVLGLMTVGRMLDAGDYTV